jgi:glycogen debranching enzyme
MPGWNADTLAGTAGAGAVTIVEGSAFCVSAANGDIMPEFPHGVFFHDTRLVSRWALLIDGDPVEPLSASTPRPYRSVAVGRAGHIPGRADTPLIVERDRKVDGGLREELTLRSYSREPMALRVELVLESDFADIFEVKEGRSARSPRPARLESPGVVRVDSPRDERLGLVVTAPGADFAGDRLTFDVVLEARGSWSRVIRLAPTTLQDEYPIGGDSDGDGDASAPVGPARRFLAWQSHVPVPDVEDDAIERVILQSQEDLGSLRIFDPAHPDRPVVAAGAPWFMALFGRDSLLTALMSLHVDPELALGTLQTLADLQGIAFDAASEEQPGRILHEVRLGATTNLALGGGSVYYGTADATPLFVVVLGELARWGGLPDDDGQLIAAADRALEWILRDGDRDGDGFVEYGRLNEHGLVNQGWKDSWDGITFADGSLARAPIALCEVQGYVYAAYVARAELAAARGDEDTAAGWYERASVLKRKFNQAFWLPEQGYFALALDADKRPVDSCASNMGHCLWSGIVDDDKAAAVAERLLSDQLFSGWGVRTLASDMGAYNPASYHNGSVWPHDNAIVAAGLMRYGFVDEANRIVQGMFDAASRFGGRLPELFCGFERQRYPEPVSYPASCSPQAWAAATPFSLLRTTLRFDPSVPTGDVWLDPTSSAGFGDIHVRNVPFAGTRVSIDVSRRGASVVGLPAGLILHPEPRPIQVPVPVRRKAK